MVSGTIGQVRERWEGARAAWSEAGLAESDLVHVETETLSVEEGRVAGERIAGPAVCELPEATLAVPPGWSGTVDDAGTIVLERRAEDRP